jgi:hypothetical protein
MSVLSARIFSLDSRKLWLELKGGGLAIAEKRVA